MHRTTFRLSPDILLEAKKFAADKNMSLTKVVEQALVLLFKIKKKPSARKKLNLPSFKGNGLKPGVDIDKSSSILDSLEDDFN